MDCLWVGFGPAAYGGWSETITGSVIEFVDKKQILLGKWWLQVIFVCSLLRLLPLLLLINLVVDWPAVGRGGQFRLSAAAVWRVRVSRRDCCCGCIGGICRVPISDHPDAFLFLLTESVCRQEGAIIDCLSRADKLLDLLLLLLKNGMRDKVNWRLASDWIGDRRGQQGGCRADTASAANWTSINGGAAAVDNERCVGGQRLAAAGGEELLLVECRAGRS